MKLPKWLPRPAAWGSAVALFLFGLGVSIAFGFVMPLLFELMRHSPRLAWLGMLVTWVAPIAGAAGIHRFASGILDFADAKGVAGGKTRGSEHWWAGFVAWAAIIFVTMTTSFVMLVLDPPPVDPDAIWNLAATMTRGVEGVVRSCVWVVLAAYVYELERSARDG